MTLVQFPPFGSAQRKKLLTRHLCTDIHTNVHHNGILLGVTPFVEESFKGSGVYMTTAQNERNMRVRTNRTQGLQVIYRDRNFLYVTTFRNPVCSSTLGAVNHVGKMFTEHTTTVKAILVFCKCFKEKGRANFLALVALLLDYQAISGTFFHIFILSNLIPCLHTRPALIPS
jgi:hypothetical protein